MEEEEAWCVCVGGRVGGRSGKVLGDALIQGDRNEQHVSEVQYVTHSIYGRPPIVDYTGL